MIDSTFYRIADNFKVQSEFIEGVPVCWLDIPNATTTSLVIIFKDGVAYESNEDWGISHFMEHILFRGTENLPTLYDISRAIEGSGGRISAYSTRDMTAFWIKSPPGSFDRAIYVMEEILTKSNFDDKFIQKEKEIITQERFREQNNPGLYNSLMIEQILLHPLPICRHPIGNDTIIEKLDSSNLREHLKKHYHKDNMVLGICGNIPGGFKGRISQFLSSFHQGEPQKKVNFSIEGDFSKDSSFYMKSHHKSQVYLSMGWKIKREGPKDIFSWRVLNSMLGSGYTSIFNKVLREEENITYLCTTKHNLYGDIGVYKLNLALADKNLKRAIELVQGIINDIAEGRINEEIFNESIIKHASHVLFQLEDTLNGAKIITQNYFRDLNDFSVREYFENLENVKKDDIFKIAANILNPSKRKIFVRTGSDIALAQIPNAKEIIIN